MVNDVLKWDSRNGPEWTVKRLKDAKAYYLSKLANKEPEMATWWRQTGPKGNRRFASVWLNLPQETEAQLVRAIRVCNAYSLFKRDQKLDPSGAQLAKFHNSVTQARSSLSNQRSMGEILRYMVELSNAERTRMFSHSLEKGKIVGVHRNGVSKDEYRRRIPLPLKFWEHSVSGTKKAPHTGFSQRDLETSFKWVVDNLTNPTVMGLLYKYKGLASSSGFTSVRNQIPGHLLGIPNKVQAGGGLISYIQEEGYKLRAVANPYRVHQVILQPLKKEALQFLSKLPTDCTHDQEAGQIWAREKLEEGRTLHAVDLSDATNNIPLSLQMISLVTSLSLDLCDKTTSDLLMYFMEVSRTTWHDKCKGDIVWTWGQPMGLGPSFPVFAIWHNQTLRIAHKRSGSKLPWQDCYRVVGDDVVIACDDTHRVYRQLLANWQIPVSEAKCISSNKCTEFVGKVITPKAGYAVPKFKSLSDRNFMDVLKQVGPSALSWCKPRQRLVAKILAQIPEDLGGLGWNPKGLPLSTRVELAAKLGLLETKPEDMPTRHVSQAAYAILNRVAYDGGLELCLDALAQTTKFSGRPRLTTSETLLKSSLPSRKASGDSEKSILKTLSEVAVDSDVNPIYGDMSEYRTGAPLSEGDPRGTSQLESWESRLKGGMIAGAFVFQEDPEIAVLLEKLNSKRSSSGETPDNLEQPNPQPSQTSSRSKNRPKGGS